MSHPGATRRAASPRPFLILGALSALFFLAVAGTFSSLGVVLPAMVGELHWSWTQAGLGFTLLAVTCGLASYAPTLVIRTLGVRATLGIGALALAAGFAALALCRGVALYYAGCGLTGLGFALVAIIPGAYVLAGHFRKVSAALGAYFTLGGLGGVAGPWLYLLARSAPGGWRGYWFGMALAALALGLIAALVVSEGPAEAAPAAVETPVPDAPAPAVYRTARAWTVRQALRSSPFWIIVAAYTVNLLCEVTVNSASVAHLTGRGITAAAAGAALSLQAAVSVGARAVGGALGDRIDPRRLVIAALALLAFGLCVLASAHGDGSAILYAVMVGAGYGLNYLAATVLLLNYYGRARNLELFSTTCLISTLASVGPLLAGAIKDRTGDFSPAFWVIAAVTLAVLVAVALMRPPRDTAASSFTRG